MRPTRNQWLFMGLFVSYSIVFQVLLTRSIEREQEEQIWKFATGYGLVTFLSGLFLGGFDQVRRHRGDIGFQYHLYTFLISLLIWVLGGALGWIPDGPSGRPTGSGPVAGPSVCSHTTRPAATR